MKTLLLIAIIGCSCSTVFGQKATIKDMVEYLNLREGKLESQLSKGGFKKTFLLSESGHAAYSFTKNETKQKDTTSIYRCYKMSKDENESSELVYQTSSLEERNELLNQLPSEGFRSPDDIMHQKKMLYQKDNITIEPAIDTVEGETYYSFHVVKKSLPRASNIVYAEDLLNFDSQEYLAAVFGSQNIKQDIFHYSQKETNRCTVLFPHTNREAIFIWNDEDNMRDLAFVIIGPGLDKIEETNGFVKIPHNTWWSKQGIYCGMSMKDVEHINQEEIKIYNWNTEAGGYLAPGNKGVIDFKRIGMIFNCWNCAIAKQESSHVISSGFFSNEYSKVFISTLIILPDKRSQTSSLSK